MLSTDPGYVSCNEVPGSDLGAKILKIYACERAFSGLRHGPHMFEANDSKVDFVLSTDSEDWLETVFSDRFYGDDVECG